MKIRVLIVYYYFSLGAGTLHTPQTTLTPRFVHFYLFIIYLFIYFWTFVFLYFYVLGCVWKQHFLGDNDFLTFSGNSDVFFFFFFLEK